MTAPPRFYTVELSAADALTLKILARLARKGAHDRALEDERLGGNYNLQRAARHRELAADYARLEWRIRIALGEVPGIPREENLPSAVPRV